MYHLKTLAKTLAIDCHGVFFGIRHVNRSTSMMTMKSKGHDQHHGQQLSTVEGVWQVVNLSWLAVDQPTPLKNMMD